MRLKEYNDKRNFDKTKEPKGKIKKGENKRFVIQFHRARRDHYDFRLSFNGVLLSWAVPKGLPTNKKDKRLAIKVEDHPLSYINFSGTIPKGEYGAGTVEIYDKGAYSCPTSLKMGLKNGSFKIDLLGDKIKGRYAFVKMEGDNWLIIYEGKNVTKNPFSKVGVELATLSKTVPSGKDYLFEIKFDGYRIVSFIETGTIKFLTRNNVDYSLKFPSLKQALLSISKDKSLVLDGEVVVFDNFGKTDFGALQEAIKFNESKLCYVVFDILALNGQDLRNLPLIERKKLLKENLKNLPKNIIISDYVVGNGKKCFEAVKKLGLEGIMAKKINSAYVEKRTEDWLKIKCYLRQEFVICGYLTSEKNSELSALILGYYKNGELIYAGKTGTGFSENIRHELSLKFKNLKQKTCPFKDVKFSANWLKPSLVCEVQFAEITKDNLLRQASFIGLREDKLAKNVTLEVKSWTLKLQTQTKLSTPKKK